MTTAAAGWALPPDRPRLAADVVDVWVADLRGAGGDEARLLSPGERARAARFVREDAGCRWARGRGLLRALAAAYLDDDPRALRLEAGPHGKPALAGAAARL